VPRILPVIAFVGAPMLLASDIAVFFGVYEKGSLLDGLAVIPIAVFEFSFGVYLVVKGFRSSSPLMAQPKADVPIPTLVPAPRAGVGGREDRGADVS
jgi:hypothetical protein